MILAELDRSEKWELPSWLPRHRNLPDNPLETIAGCRAAFEVLLRKLVIETRPQVRFMLGTVTGMETNEPPTTEDPSFVRTVLAVWVRKGQSASAERIPVTSLFG